MGKKKKRVVVTSFALLAFSRLFFDGRRAPCVRVGLGWFEETSGGGPGCAGGGGVERGAERARKLVSSFGLGGKEVSAGPVFLCRSKQVNASRERSTS